MQYVCSKNVVSSRSLVHFSEYKHRLCQQSHKYDMLLLSLVSVKLLDDFIDAKFFVDRTGN